MNGVEYLIGSESICNMPLPAYAQESCAFANALSMRLMKSPALRAYPDITALAFWCRRANIERLKAGCEEADKRLGRGLCFHIAPSNIPINFAFSYLFALLAGNASIVRLPSKPFGQTAPVCEAVREALRDFPEIEKRTVFIRYKADNEISAAFCAMADARLIWGGDATIANIKALKAKPRCVDIAFADRYSICMLNADAILRLDEAAIKRLAESFYNDTYLMDQNACSSPQLILWVNDAKEARARFWDAVFACAKEKYALQAAVSVDKYTHMCEDAAQLDILLGVERRENLLYHAELSALKEDMECLRGKGGYFYEYSLKSLDELAPVVTEKYQSLTQFGMDAQALRAWVVENRLRGIDRIAPVGKAMDVSVLWDGFDLVRMLSRIVNVED